MSLSLCLENQSWTWQGCKRDWNYLFFRYHCYSTFTDLTSQSQQSWAPVQNWLWYLEKVAEYIFKNPGPEPLLADILMVQFCLPWKIHITSLRTGKPMLWAKGRVTGKLQPLPCLSFIWERIRWYSFRAVSHGRCCVMIILREDICIFHSCYIIKKKIACTADVRDKIKILF